MIDRTQTEYSNQVEPNALWIAIRAINVRFMQPGPKIELAAERLGEDVGLWVVALRNDDRSWQYIADKLAEKTKVVVSREWLRHLYATQAEQAAASAA